jgi:hypothetical protein
MASASGGLILGPTVPAGHLWVVKSISISYGLNVVSGRALIQANGIAVLETGAGFGASYPGTAHIYGTFPLLAGESLSAVVDTWTVDFYVGGFDFLEP